LTVFQRDRRTTAKPYTGLFKIGDRTAGVVTAVQVVDDFRSDCWPMPLAAYVDRGILPNHDELPWRDDWVRGSSRGQIG
jgi:hypothetical protein